MIRILLLVMAATTLRAATPPDVDALLDHHAAALGWPRDAPQDSLLHVVADLSGLGLEGDLESWSEPPLRTRSLLRLGPIVLETGFDGTTAWIRDRNGAVREAEAQERNGLLLDALVQTGAYLLRQPPLPLRRSVIELDSTRVQLTLLPLFGEELKLELDAFTQRVISSSWHNGQSEESTHYSDYAWFGGLLFARTMELHQGGLRIRAELRSLERGAPLGAAFYAMPSTDPPRDVRLDDPRGSGPIEMAGEGRHILLDGSIGELTGRFLLDTGAGGNVLSASAARQLGLVAQGEFETIGVAGTEDASFVEVASVRIGGLELLEQSWVALDFSALQGALGDDLLGVIGYDTLSRLVTHVDYAKRRVEFVEPSAFVAPDDAVSLALRMDLNVPTVLVEVEGHAAWMHVDTGSDNTVDLAAPFIAEHRLLEDRGELERSSLLGVGGTRSSLAGRLRSFSLGPFDYEDLTAYFHEAGDGIFDNRSAAGIVGAGLLEDFELWFDYGRRTLWLRRAD